MKKIVFIILLIFNSGILLAQNYFKEYPITTIIAYNGSQQRLECSTYDSVLQTIVTYETPWMSEIISVTNNDGKVTFTTWVEPGQQSGVYGFLIYDFVLHQFSVQNKIFSVASSYNLNMAAGMIWFVELLEYENSGIYSSSYTYYRYNMLHHTWTQITITKEPDYSSNLWYLNASINSDLIGYIDDEDEGDFFYLDPVSNQLTSFGSGCAGWGFTSADDYIAMDTGCLDNYRFMTYDAETHQWNGLNRADLLGTHTRGVFTASDQNTYVPRFFFTYDQAIHAYIVDSVVSSNITNVIIKDRIITYVDQTPGFSQKIFFMAHNPLLHTWVKDSLPLTGGMISASIENGTVNWVDGNGSHIRGYDINLGWGNYTTPLFLYFHLTDFTSQGHPMIHVRNYSIGSDKVYYDFGDGVISLNNRHVLWHSYNNSGSYNICIYDSSGTQSWCDSLILNLCSSTGAASATANTLCEGDSVTLSLATFSGSVQWQSALPNGLWLDETGPGALLPSYTFAPMQTKKYRARVTNGSCVSVFSNEQLVNVYEDPAGNYLADTTVSLCHGQSVILKIEGIAANFKWQMSDGINWYDASTITSNPYFNVTPSYTTLYRVIIFSGSCFIDTSDVVTVTLDSLPQLPVTTSDAICGPGVVMMQATGVGTINWYLTSINDSIVNSGNTYSPFLNVTTNYNVQSTTGSSQVAGYTDQSIGGTYIDTSLTRAIRFQSTDHGLLQSISIYPTQTGTLYFFLKNIATGLNEQTKTVIINSASGKQKCVLNMQIKGGITYDLFVNAQTVPLTANNSGANYPLNISGSAINILGYTDSIFHSTPDYYNYYDWKFSSGCQSALVPVVGAVEAPISNAAIIPNGPTSFCQGGSVTLQGSPAGPYTYTWLRDNIVIIGATSVNYVATSSGLYHSIVSNPGCLDSSNSIQVTVPCLQPLDPEAKSIVTDGNEDNLYYVFYNEDSYTLTIDLQVKLPGVYNYSVIDKSGRELLSKSMNFQPGNHSVFFQVNHLAIGMYFVKAEGGNETRVLKFVKY